MIIILIPFLLIVEDYESQLEKVKSEIDTRKKEVKRLKEKEKSILNEIDKINRKISKSKTKLKELKNQEKKLKESIRVLELDGGKILSELKQQEDLMGDKVRLMYQYNISNFAPQVNPNQARIIFYMQQIIKQDINWHANLKETRKVITTKEEAEKSKLTELLKIKMRVEEEQKKILAQSQKKKQILKNVKAKEAQKLKLIKELEEARADLEKLIAKVQKYPSKELGHIRWPVQGELISKFGTVIDPKLGTKLINKGIDIRAPYGANVIAVSEGNVVYEGNFLGYGKIVLLDHRNGFCTLYGYLSETLVTTGDKVSKEEVIGRVGTSSLANEPALHFELRKNGVAVDPLKWLE